MENPWNFFRALNKNVKEAKTRKTLKILEKQGRKYIKEIPSSTSTNIQRSAKREFKESLKLIRKQHKKLK